MRRARRLCHSGFVAHVHSGSQLPPPSSRTGRCTRLFSPLLPPCTSLRRLMESHPQIDDFKTRQMRSAICTRLTAAMRRIAGGSVHLPSETSSVSGPADGVCGGGGSSLLIPDLTVRRGRGAQAGPSSTSAACGPTRPSRPPRPRATRWPRPGHSLTRSLALELAGSPAPSGTSTAASWPDATDTQPAAGVRPHRQGPPATGLSCRVPGRPKHLRTCAALPRTGHRRVCGIPHAVSG
jgi:hypothetical protein